MADTKISALTTVTAAVLTDVFAVVQGGTTKGETLTQAFTTISSSNIAATKSFEMRATAGSSPACVVAQGTANGTADNNYIDLFIDGDGGSATTGDGAGTDNLLCRTYSSAAFHTIFSVTRSTRIMDVTGTFTGGSIEADNGFDGTYSTGNLTIVGGIITAIV